METTTTTATTTTTTTTTNELAITTTQLLRTSETNEAMDGLRNGLRNERTDLRTNDEIFSRRATTTSHLATPNHDPPRPTTTHHDPPQPTTTNDTHPATTRTASQTSRRPDRQPDRIPNPNTQHTIHPFIPTLQHCNIANQPTKATNEGNEGCRASNALPPSLTHPQCTSACSQPHHTH